MEHTFPQFRAAAAQCSPVFLDRDATTDKACSLIREAARNRARVIALPEAYIPGYPQWIWMDRPEQGERYFVRFVKNCVTVPSPTTDKLCRAAREGEIYVAIGINETSESSFAEIFNTLLLIGSDGKIIGKHRKIMPTFAEKLIWSFGDGSTLRTHDTDIGKIGMLICGENGNSLARFALIAQSEQVHISNYPAYPANDHYDLRRAIEVRAAAHAFEGKVFNIVSCSLIDDNLRRELADIPGAEEKLQGGSNGFTGILGPDASILTDPISDSEEGIVYADIDLEKSLKEKLRQDIAGNYNRFDILSLNLNPKERRAIWTTGRKAEEGERRGTDETARLLDQIGDERLRADLQDLITRLTEGLINKGDR